MTLTCCTLFPPSWFWLARPSWRLRREDHVAPTSNTCSCSRSAAAVWNVKCGWCRQVRISKCSRDSSADSLVLKIQNGIFPKLTLHSEPQQIFTQFKVYYIPQNTEIKYLWWHLNCSLAWKPLEISWTKQVDYDSMENKFEKFQLMSTNCFCYVLNKFTAHGDQLASLP